MHMNLKVPSDFYGKRILILGLGLHGGGVGSAYWFFRQGAEVIVTDIRSRSELSPSIAKLTVLCNEYRLAHSGKRLHSIEYVLGAHRGNDVVRADIVIQNPGVPRDSLFLTIARERRVPIHNDASIFFSLVRKSPILGVTGTRGKSTTTALIADMLKQTYPRACAAGIATPTGATSFFSAIDHALEDERKGCSTPVVLELSSWQLEVLGAHGMSPPCAVVTNIYPDHLNRYSSMEEYIDAKKNIIRFQSAGDTAILNADDPVLRTWVADCVRGCTVVWFSRKERPCPGQRYGIRGAHNEENVSAAAAAAKQFGVPPDAVCSVCASFQGVPCRLQKIAKHRGRLFYNDTAATSPDAACAALKTLGGRSKKIVLIAGGADKRLVSDGFGAEIARSVKALVFLSGTATPSIASAATAAGYSGSLDRAHSMEEAVQTAWKRSEKGDIILLSPGAASFGLFQHEFDRGNQFVEAVEKLRSL